MATKDWKKVVPLWIAPREIMRWQNVKTQNMFVGINEKSYFHRQGGKIVRNESGVAKTSPGYGVSMEFNQFLGGFNKHRTFKTKSEALTFAKSYMRKH